MDRSMFKILAVIFLFTTVISSVTAKPGECPPFPMMCPASNTGCTSDDQCPGRLKCCQVQCGPLSCTKPV